MLNEHFATDETPQELAKRLNCVLSTAEMKMNDVTTPTSVRHTTKSTTGFVEVKQDRCHAGLQSHTTRRAAFKAKR